jgi:hypothetical protein
VAAAPDVTVSASAETRNYPRVVAEALAAAFPAAIRESAVRVVSILPPSESPPHAGSTVRVGNETLEIPSRIYHREVLAEVEDSLGEVERVVLACLFTRHYHGHVRQRHLGRVIDRAEPWVVPFVVQLIGEYVVEIAVEIRERLGDLDVVGSARRKQYGEFARANAPFVDLTARRVVSYWNEYYRDRYPTLDEYPGSALIASLRQAADDL